jgi:hypothetical protein
MKTAIQSRRKKAGIAALAFALGAGISLQSVWGQNAATLAGNGSGPILSFSPGIVSTTAGDGTGGYGGDGGPATSAQLNYPIGLTGDRQGNLYVADFMNNVVRKIGTDGTISTVAGNGTQGYSGDGGPATGAQLAYPAAVAVDAAGNLYIGEFLNSCVRKVDTNGIISTLATGLLIRGVAADANGNVYFSSWYEGVWKVDSQGVTTRVAGNGTAGFSGDGGPATDAQTSGVTGLALDNQGNLYIAEAVNNDIRKVDTNGIITTVAGDHQPGFAGDGGPATRARFNGPTDVKIDAAGDLYIVDSSNNRIRKVNVGGTISTIAGDGNFGYAGDGGLASHAQFAGPMGIALDGKGNLYVADTTNNVIRQLRMDSTTLDFGTVTVGQTGGPLSVTVSNVGMDDLHISSIVASDNFSLDTTCPVNNSLGAGSDCMVSVSFAPIMSGKITGTATVSSDAPETPHILNLEGQGYSVQVATQLAFATKFPVLPPNGNLGTVEVDALDSNGNLVTGFTGPVSVAILGPSGFTPYSAQVNASGGIATFNLTTVSFGVAGSYSITATSGGLTAAQGSFTVKGNPDFTLSLSSGSLKMTTSGTGALNVTVSPANGFNGKISLSCSSLPSHSTCSFVPASVTADGSDTPLASVLTISTGVSSEVVAKNLGEPVFLASATGTFSMGLVGFVFAAVWQRRDKGGRRAQCIELALILIILCVGLSACGRIGDGNQTTTTPPGTYAVTVTGTSAGVTHSSVLTLTIGQ